MKKGLLLLLVPLLCGFMPAKLARLKAHAMATAIVSFQVIELRRSVGLAAVVLAY